MTQARFADEEKDQEEDKDGRGPHLQTPDGGWGWVIVLASFVCNMVVDGLCMSYGILQPEIKSHFDCDSSQAALVGSLLAGCYLTAGPIGSVLVNRFGCRKVTIIGSLITAAAFALSTYSPSIQLMIVIYGIIGGIGLGLVYLPAVVIVGYWFEANRALATGVAVCGSGIGTFVFAPFTQMLLDEYDWKGSTLIMAGVVLHCMICGAVFRPIEHAKPKRMKRGVVQRGSIMKALIAEKERQRTISNGSLDNCIITKDNRLIKIDKNGLRNKSHSYLNRLKEQLGFSSRSLNKSNGLVTPSIIVGDNVSICSNGPIYKRAPRTKHNSIGSPVSIKRDSGCGSLEIPKENSKCRSYEALPQDDPWEKLTGELNTKSMSFQYLNKPAENGTLNNSFNSIPTYMPAGSRISSQGRTYKSTRSFLLPPGSIVGASVVSLPQYSASIRSIPSDYEYSGFRGFLRMVQDTLDLGLFCRPTFILYTCVSVLSMLGYFIPYFFLPKKAKELLGEENDGVYLLSIIGISNTVGRVAAGWVSDRPCVCPIVINSIALIISGVITLLCSMYLDYTALALYAAGFGFFTAAFLSLRSILLVELIGLEKLTSSFGLLILFQGIAIIAGPPIAGLLIDKTDNTDAAFYMAGTLLTLAGVLGWILCKTKRWEERRWKRFRIVNVDEIGMHEPLKIDQVETTI